MIITLIWVLTIAAYIGFRAWFDNWRGALSTLEIEKYDALLDASDTISEADKASVKAFMRDDDGKEFIMLNLVRLHPAKIEDPATGKMAEPMKVLSRYTNKFVPQLMRRAGYPGFVARKSAGYVDSWNVDADPEWSFIGYMRYRSRRDMMEMATLQAFRTIHHFKIAAMDATASFPTSPRLIGLMGPRVWVGLVMALIAAFATIAVMA